MAFKETFLLVALLSFPACDATSNTSVVEKALRSPHGSSSLDSSPALNAPSMDMTSAAMEAALTDLMLGKTSFGATPMGGSVKKIENLITKEMMPAVLAAHKIDQRNLIRLINEIKKCGSTKAGSLSKAAPPRREYFKDSKLHQNCRKSQAVLFESARACTAQQRALYKEKVLKCNHFAEISKKYGTQKANFAIVKKAGSEKTEQYIRRISATFCGKHIHGEKGRKTGKGGWGGGLPGSMLDIYLRAKAACEKATVRYNNKVKECKRKWAAFNVKRSKCNQYQKLMDTNSCKHAVMVKDTCESYAGCYYARKRDYRMYERKAIAEETDRKAEWRGLKRMECLIKAFADGKVTNAEVNTCKKQSHSTKLLNLKYPKVPPLQKCEFPTLYPATGAYKRREFEPLPTLAKGVQSAPCSGMDVIPTKPRNGSPRGAKCARVPLQGYYSPGALIKCTNGLDVRRSNDRNSCPQGTKIFSPATRSDWKTFLASTGPLRAPHWIIDVTRPARGCGGCTGNPMNSNNKNQKTWKTSDGSPWWLRSSRFSEPNGDYTANCFLDLWHGKPRNENYVSFNDGNCNYHSKSYYCQPIYLRLKPKSGSPRSCKCSRVDLTAKYTAGVLVKCEQCLTVYRSTQKNSCPNGMKIFSPATRSDWKTFLSSAGPLRAPHWIIDVTRPQNGCGGCKKYSMKSTTPQQATWKTSDGSPWWLRSRVYGEPNGDYTGNCFMSLNPNPTSPDTLRFNDWNCNYRSRSYYCQPKKNNKNYGGHHRRRRAPVVKPKKPVPTLPKDIKAIARGYCTDGQKKLVYYSYKRNVKSPVACWNLVNKQGGDTFSFRYQGGGNYCFFHHRMKGRKVAGWVNGPGNGYGKTKGPAKGGDGYARQTCYTKRGGIKPPVGVMQNYNQQKLFNAGWKVWKDVPYRHHTVRKDIQPTKGQCILWGSKKSSGTTTLAIAAIGRRKIIENKKRVMENGVYWYTQTLKSGSGSCGFSPNKQLSLNSADTHNSQGHLRLSWHLHTNMKVGGYRSGKTKGLNNDGTWRKVVMYGPCSGFPKVVVKAKMAQKKR